MKTREIPSFYFYKPVPEKKGYVTFDRAMTYDELDKALTAYLKDFNMLHSGYVHSAYDWLDYLNVGSLKDSDDQIPYEGRIVSFVVEGGSEGYYFHIDCIQNDGEVVTIALGKTLIEDIDFALRIQKHFAKFIILAQH